MIQHIEFMTSIDPGLISSLHILAGKAEKAAIVTHMHPDGDAIGSSTGLMRYLKASGKQAVTVLHDRYPESLAFLAEGDTDSIIVHEENPEAAAKAVNSADLLFCLDMNTFSRAEKMSRILEECKCPKVLIDHHLNPDTGKFSLMFSEVDVSSTSELLYHILMKMPDIAGDASNLPRKCAEALLAGMTTDTNNFSNSVYPSTFMMASQLLAAGIDRDAVVAALYTNYRENRFRLMGELLSENMAITEDGAAYMIIDKALARKYDIKEGETEGFVNMPLGIGCVRMSLLLKEEDDRFRVSIRSKKGISANKFSAVYFHGGGHELAAGGRLMKGEDLPCGTAEEASHYVKEKLKEFFSGGASR